MYFFTASGSIAVISENYRKTRDVSKGVVDSDATMDEETSNEIMIAETEFLRDFLRPHCHLLDSCVNLATQWAAVKTCLVEMSMPRQTNESVPETHEDYIPCLQSTAKLNLLMKRLNLLRIDNLNEFQGRLLKKSELKSRQLSLHWAIPPACSFFGRTRRERARAALSLRTKASFFNNLFRILNFKIGDTRCTSSSSIFKTNWNWIERRI